MESNTITFTYEDKTYTLEYNRESARALGAELARLDGDVIGGVEAIVSHAFTMHHSNVSKKKRLEMYSLMGSSEELIETLNQMYQEAIVDNTISKESKISWDASL